MANICKSSTTWHVLFRVKLKCKTEVARQTVLMFI